MRMSVSSPASTPAMRDAMKTSINPVLRLFECQDFLVGLCMIVLSSLVGELGTVLGLVRRNYKKA